MRPGRAERLPGMDPAVFFDRPLVVAAPHMDDEVLACGALLARIADKSRVRFLYATDGSGSETLHLPGVKSELKRDIRDIRLEETRAALAALGYAQPPLERLAAGDGRVGARAAEFQALLAGQLRAAGAGFLLAPFRFDRNPDHTAVNAACRRALRAPECAGVTLLEYFVYYHSRFLPSGDIRDYCRADRLLACNCAGQTELKRQAILCFKSQTTCYQSWQTRPVLSPELIAEAAAGPEIFLVETPAQRGSNPCRLHPLWLGGLIRVEHRLKVWKEQIGFWLR